MHNICRIGALSFVPVLAGAAMAFAQAAPPDGTYECATSTGSIAQGTYIVQPMGKMEIRSGQYRYNPQGGSGEWAALRNDGGKLTFAGNMGALNSGSSRITESSVERGSTYVSIIVKYQARPGAYIETMSCRRG